MKTFLRAALVWLLGLLSAQATVLVYHGSGRRLAATQTGYSAAENCYLIVDLNAGEMTVITYGTLQNKKEQQAIVYQATLDESPVSGPPGQTYEVFAYVDRTTVGPAFGDYAAIFRGVECAVNISGGVGRYSTEQHPRTLSGIYRLFGSGLGANYSEESYTLTFDQADTLQANNGSLGIAQVQANISGNLTTAGYPP